MIQVSEKRRGFVVVDGRLYHVEESWRDGGPVYVSEDVTDRVRGDLEGVLE